MHEHPFKFQGSGSLNDRGTELKSRSSAAWAQAAPCRSMGSSFPPHFWRLHQSSSKRERWPVIIFTARQRVRWDIFTIIGFKDCSYSGCDVINDWGSIMAAIYINLSLKTKTSHTPDSTSKNEYRWCFTGTSDSNRKEVTQLLTPFITHTRER
jgi:hypothetical protein